MNFAKEDSGSFRSPPLSCPGGKADPIRGKLTGSDSLTRPKRKRTRFYHNQARANYTPGGGLHVFHLVENDMSRDE
ncbi:MAG: hypothetical protein J6C58_09295 [Bacteroidaceae bacterium]|nr:hypothetical protein [Bacteroidaceae bacterium]